MPLYPYLHLEHNLISDFSFIIELSLLDYGAAVRTMVCTHISVYIVTLDAGVYKAGSVCTTVLDSTHGCPLPSETITLTVICSCTLNLSYCTVSHSYLRSSEFFYSTDHESVMENTCSVCSQCCLYSLGLLTVNRLTGP